MQRTKNASRNIVFGMFQNVYQLLGPFIVRTIFIYTLGIEYLGLNSLFTSILTVLNLAELGVGSALVFSMYKPIVEQDTEKICALMNLYKKYYRIIGFTILGLGLAVTPFLKYLIAGNPPTDINIYVIYLMNLLATVLSYLLFAYKGSIFFAHQRNDIRSRIEMVTATLQYVLQAVVLVVFGNYYLYLVIIIVKQIINNLYISGKANKEYPDYKAKGKLEKKEVKVINKRVRDLFTAKVGSIVVDYSDSIVISAFLGLKILAKYNNYFYIMTALFSFISIIFTSCMAGIGNSIIVESKEKNYKDLKKLLMIICWISIFCISCLLCTYQPFMKIWVGEKYMLGFGIVICFCVYFFVYEIDRVLNTYKDAAGIWHEDRFRPLVTAIVNLIMNLILVQYIGLFGVLLSTVLSKTIIGIPWLFYNLFTVMFKRKPWELIMTVIKYFLIAFVISIICYYICSLISVKGILEFIIKLCISGVVSNLILFMILRREKEFGEVKNMFFSILKLRKKNKVNDI